MDPALLREDMVDGLEHEAKGHVETDRVAEAMRSVPREHFVPEERTAYEDRDHEVQGTRVLAPGIVARLLEALAVEPGDDVLVVGAGVGYTAAVCAELAGAEHVHALDIDRRLVLEARSNLRTAGYRDVLVDRGDGAEGLPAYAPFERILVEAAALDPPQALLEQRADGGRLVMPRGTGTQTIVAIESTVGDAEPVEKFGRVRFDPLLLEGEQRGTIERNRTQREDREFAERNARARTGWEHEWIEWE
jgi:protein-L-isoaspartate(D-aspartate) O-methyltransferase